MNDQILNVCRSSIVLKYSVRNSSANHWILLNRVALNARAQIRQNGFTSIAKVFIFNSLFRCYNSMDILSIETNRKGKLHYTYLVKTARCIKGKWVTFKADSFVYNICSLLKRCLPKRILLTPLGSTSFLFRVEPLSEGNLHAVK